MVTSREDVLVHMIEYIQKNAIADAVHAPSLRFTGIIALAMTAALRHPEWAAAWAKLAMPEHDVLFDSAVEHFVNVNPVEGVEL